MKKALFIIGIIIAVLVAALLMWKIVFPFIGWVFGCISGGVSFSFGSIGDFFQSLF